MKSGFLDEDLACKVWRKGLCRGESDLSIHYCSFKNMALGLEFRCLLNVLLIAER